MPGDHYKFAVDGTFWHSGGQIQELVVLESGVENEEKLVQCYKFSNYRTEYLSSQILDKTQ